MMNTYSLLKSAKNLIFIVSVVALSVACGGGSGDTNPTGFSYLPVSYANQAGLIWSSPTTQTFKYSAWGIAADLNTMEPYASAYCEQTTCTSKDQYGRDTNCSSTNFNKSLGWRLPTPIELRAFFLAIPSPSNWKIGLTWTNDGNLYDPSNGHTIITNYLRGYVTCVKPG